MSTVEQRGHRLDRWFKRLQAAHLDGFIRAALEAGEPLAPFGAQLLWVAQPVLGLLIPRDDIAALATLLDDPDGVAWLRSRLNDDEMTYDQ